MGPTTAARQDSLGITEHSVLMQIRASVLNDLARHIPADYYSSHGRRSKLAIFESENLDRIRHLARVDFDLAKELIEKNDSSPTFTPRDVSAIEVLNAVGYYLMFLGLDEDQRTPHRLDRMRMAESKLNSALNLYVHHLHDSQARLINTALAASNAVAIATIEPAALQFNSSIADTDCQLTDESTGAIQVDTQIDFDLLATPAQLLRAFENWGLKERWFKELSSHAWLKAARRLKGKGQRGRVIKPLFCPLAVMNGLTTNIRGRARMGPEKGWAVLDHHFPNVVHANSVADPRERTG